MKPEVATLMADALQSGMYPQIKGSLGWYNNGFCFVGVLQEMAVLHGHPRSQSVAEKFAGMTPGEMGSWISANDRWASFPILARFARVNVTPTGNRDESMARLQAAEFTHGLTHPTVHQDQAALRAQYLAEYEEAKAASGN